MAMGNLNGIDQILHKFYCPKMFLFNLFNKKDKEQYYFCVTL